MNESLKQLIELAGNLRKRNYFVYNEAFLEKTVRSRMQVCQCGTMQDYSVLLASSENESLTFQKSLNNSYSEFFRLKTVFSILESSIIPSIFNRIIKCRTREIRIWSAGCASGQEAFSLAMLLEQYVLKNNPDITYRVIATDKSYEQIATAEKAEYEKYELDNISLKQFDQFFQKTKNGKYCIVPGLKNKVQFSVFDLTDELHLAPPTSIFGGFDLILCCNLIYYYHPETESIIINKLLNNLNIKGFLITDEAEKAIIKKYSQLKQFSMSLPVFEKLPGQKQQPTQPTPEYL